jgi:hypothetical protein
MAYALKFIEDGKLLFEVAVPEAMAAEITRKHASIGHVRGVSIVLSQEAFPLLPTREELEVQGAA